MKTPRQDDVKKLVEYRSRKYKTEVEEFPLELDVISATGEQFQTRGAFPQEQYSAKRAITYKFKTINDEEPLKRDKDTRKKIHNTTEYPLSAFGVVKIDLGDDLYNWGTGVLIGPEFVLTSARIIFGYENSKKKFPANKLEFIPAMNGQEAPFGAIKVKESYIPRDYDDADIHTDFAILSLEQPIGYKTGYLGIDVLKKKRGLGDRILHICGYPSDKNYEKPGQLEQWLAKEELWEFSDKPRSLIDQDKKTEPVIQYNEKGLKVTHGDCGTGVFYIDEKYKTYMIVGVQSEISEFAPFAKHHFDQIMEWVFRDRTAMRAQKALSKERDRDELNLDYHVLKDEGAGYLSDMELPLLGILRLRDTKIKDSGATQLAMNTTWRNLQELYLNWNQIGDAGASSLAANTSWVKLEKLSLAENRIGDEGAQDLGSNTTWTNLKVLWLYKNQIGNAGAVGLASNKSWTNLLRLSLWGNQIGDEGGAHLSANSAWINLEELSLFQNRITDRGASAIAQNLKWWRNIKQLYLGENKITEDGNKVLRNNPIMKKNGTDIRT